MSYEEGVRQGREPSGLTVPFVHLLTILVLRKIYFDLVRCLLKNPRRIAIESPKMFVQICTDAFLV